MNQPWPDAAPLSATPSNNSIASPAWITLTVPRRMKETLVPSAITWPSSVASASSTGRGAVPLRSTFTFSRPATLPLKRSAPFSLFRVCKPSMARIVAAAAPSPDSEIVEENPTALPGAGSSRSKACLVSSCSVVIVTRNSFAVSAFGSSGSSGLRSRKRVPSDSRRTVQVFRPSPATLVTSPVPVRPRLMTSGRPWWTRSFAVMAPCTRSMPAMRSVFVSAEKKSGTGFSLSTGTRTIFSS